MDVLIVGCGYLGRRAAEAWRAQGHRVTALTRSPPKAESLHSSGIMPMIGDILDAATIAALPAADVLLVALTHDPASAVPKRALLVDGVGNLVKETHSRVRHVIYVSSTSVYGQHDGSWVDETSPTEPTTKGGQITLDAERALLHIGDGSESSCRLTILRLAEIYGPGRLIARVDQLRSGARVAGSPEAWLNLIHVDDAAACVCAAAEGRHTSPVILVCNDRPVTRGEFYGAIARAVGAPEPGFDPSLTEGRRTSGLNKRCRNARMHAELCINLQHPDAIAALPEIIQESARIS